MRTKISRTLCSSRIEAFTMEVIEGVPTVKTLDTVTVVGKVNNSQALKVLKKTYGKDTPITVAKIDVVEDTYEISVDDFLKYATKVTNDSEPSENDSEVSE